MGTDKKWTSYLAAAGRKGKIAAYHRDELTRLLNAQLSSGSLRELPRICIQAHFEGVLFSVTAAADQIAQAANSALELGATPSDLFDRAFSVLVEELPDLRAWRDNPLGRDVRALRTRAIHYSYAKTPVGTDWQVEETDAPYRGSRELREYGDDAVRYVQELVAWVQKIESKLRARQPGVRGATASD